jgi:hypothetical protein
LDEEFGETYCRDDNSTKTPGRITVCQWPVVLIVVFPSSGLTPPPDRNLLFHGYWFALFLLMLPVVFDVFALAQVNRKTLPANNGVSGTLVAVVTSTKQPITPGT